ncbi:MAG: hypothetical protein AB8U25_00535 [Rickettsiales endosymbiont of Dermacentor nuttalli]
MHLAVQNGDIKEIQELDTKGVSIEIQDEEGKTAIHWADVLMDVLI